MAEQTQKQDLIASFKRLGGIATLRQLYDETTEINDWETKTPFASIRRLVQNKDGKDDFVRLRAGLYCLKKHYKKFSHFQEGKKSSKAKEDTHSYIQGLLLDLGQMQEFDTYAPMNNRNKVFLTRENKNVDDFCTIKKLPDFSYDNLVRIAKQVDVIWLNKKRKMPTCFFEVEYTTNMKDSFAKFVELQDFYAKFIIAAPNRRKSTFEDVREMSAYEVMEKRIIFRSFETIEESYKNQKALLQNMI